MDPTVDEKTVTFNVIPIWTVGDENVVAYTLPAGFEEQEADWIGIYKVIFLDLSSKIKNKKLTFKI